MFYIIEPEQCPETHPFSYRGGRYCCQYGIENNMFTADERCDGGPISLTSTCCKDNAWIKCPSGKCKNRGR